MSDEPAEFDYANREQSVWQENHGTVLVVLAIVIGSIGCGIIALRQLRFVRPDFPTTDAFPDTLAAMGLEEARNSRDISPAILVPALLEASAPTITISVSGAENDRGAMMLAIYDSAENFNQPEKTPLKGPAPVINGATKVRIPLKSLPSQFAVAAYHDENANSVLDKSPLGIPIERYGFSNEARAMIGAPFFHEAVVDCPEQGGEIVIEIK